MTRRNPRPPYQWSEEETNFVLNNYIGCGYINMTKKLIETFGSDITRAQVKSFYNRNHLNSGLTGRFEKGHVPITPLHFKVWEDPRSVKNRFKKGCTPMNVRPVGTILIDRDVSKKYAYYKIKIAEPNVWKFLHIHNWEQVHGPYDKSKYCILFLDGNTLNCDPSNLRLIKRTEHVLFNHYGIPRNFQSDEELTAYRNIVNLKSNIYRKKRSLKHGRNKKDSVFYSSCEDSERNSSAAQGEH